MNKRVLSLTLLLACLGLMTMQAEGRKVESFNSGWSFKKAPAEKVRTKRQVPPEKWEIVYGTYRENLRLYFLPTDEAEHGYWFGFESEIQKIQPVFKAKN